MKKKVTKKLALGLMIGATLASSLMPVMAADPGVYPGTIYYDVDGKGGVDVTLPEHWKECDKNAPGAKLWQTTYEVKEGGNWVEVSKEYYEANEAKYPDGSKRVTDHPTGDWKECDVSKYDSVKQEFGEDYVKSEVVPDKDKKIKVSSESAYLRIPEEFRAGSEAKSDYYEVNEARYDITSDKDCEGNQLRKTEVKGYKTYTDDGQHPYDPDWLYVGSIDDNNADWNAKWDRAKELEKKLGLSEGALTKQTKSSKIDPSMSIDNIITLNGLFTNGNPSDGSGNGTCHVCGNIVKLENENEVVATAEELKKKLVAAGWEVVDVTDTKLLPEAWDTTGVGNNEDPNFNEPLKIYVYSGTGTLTIDNSHPWKGIILAPKADVKVNSTVCKGAIVARSVDFINGGQIHKYGDGSGKSSASDPRWIREPEVTWYIRDFQYYKYGEKTAYYYKENLRTYEVKELVVKTMKYANPNYLPKTGDMTTWYVLGGLFVLVVAGVVVLTRKKED